MFLLHKPHYWTYIIYVDYSIGIGVHLQNFETGFHYLLDGPALPALSPEQHVLSPLSSFEPSYLWGYTFSMVVVGKQKQREHNLVCGIIHCPASILYKSIAGRYRFIKGYLLGGLFVCGVEVLRPSQPNRVMSSAVSLPNHTFTGQA